ncbi:MAG: type II secretion system protein [Gammaproteobacteria bacterium]
MRARGFTLVEMVMVIIILSVLGALTAPMMLKGMEAYEGTHRSLRTLDKLRYATERLAREIRETDLNAGAYVISMATAPPLTFTKTDGVLVTVSSGGSNLNLGYSTPAVSEVLTDELSSVAFAYFDADGSAAAVTARSVRYVEITLTLTNPANGQNYSQRTRVALRDRA